MKITKVLVIATIVAIVQAVPAFGQWVKTSITANGLIVSGNYLLAGGATIFRSSDNGATWVDASAGLPTGNHSFESFATIGSTVFVAAHGAAGGVCRSTDDGATWTPVNNGLPDLEMTCLASGGSVLYAGAGIYGTIPSLSRSTNLGESWSVLPLPLGWSSGTVVVNLAVSGPYLLVGTGGQGMYRTSNNGSSWEQVNSGLVDRWGRVDRIHSLCVRDTEIFASAYGAFRSTNNGTTWTAVNNGLWNIYVNAYAFAGQNLFAATAGNGVFLSTNSGADWAAVNQGIESTNFTSLTVSGSYLLAGWYGGLWRRPLSEMVTSVEENASDVPREFRIEQNYPNPFNPETIIRYTVAGTRNSGLGTRNTRLVVYDVLGRQVATLVDEVKSPGSYEVRFDGSGLSSGVYFYRLMAGDYIRVRRMLLVR